MGSRCWVATRLWVWEEMPGMDETAKAWDSPVTINE